jgi:rSAM/selenodomain-associated transferase 2
MLSVIIPVLNPDARFREALAVIKSELGPLGAEIIVSSAGMSTEAVGWCKEASANIVESEKGRGQQLAAGALQANQSWLLFLHADSILPKGAGSLIAVFMMDALNDGRAAYFRLGYDDEAPAIARIARLANWRARTWGLPYGDQGLLISKNLYDRIGGYADLPLMEDVDLVRRLGKGRLVLLDGTMITSAERYRTGGTWLRPIRNLLCLGLFFCRAPISFIQRLYGVGR